MNLLRDKWLPVRCLDGSQVDIAPAEIVRSDVVDLACPRPDFQGGLYQLLVGLLQTVFAPKDYEEWKQYWEIPPSAERLSATFSIFQPAFEMHSSLGKPAFLQDLSMAEGEERAISLLLIEAPGDNALKKNLAHFIKEDEGAAFCDGCAATALFTLQTNAPAGGQGYRVGLRGGGPLTTLLLPTVESCSLWHRLWLNVLVADEFVESIAEPHADVLPWIGKTRVSDKTGSETMPVDVHPLQMYWGMPRRIRLQGAEGAGTCSICGKHNVALVSDYLTKNYGTNYEGPWQHPLTPYRLDANNEKPPLSLKGQPGGLGYRHWLAMNWGDATNGDTPAQSVSSYYANKADLLSGMQAKLWCFGYDMDKMKARCWYEQQVPVTGVPQQYQDAFKKQVGTLLTAARDTVKELRQQVKSAWFSRPQDTKGDVSMIDASFWQATEADFYALVHQLASKAHELRFMPEETGRQWAKVLRRRAQDLFDYWALEGEAENMDMKRITKARRMLLGKLKSMKSLAALDQAGDKEAA